MQSIFDYSELDEMTDGKTPEELEKELVFQVSVMGESLGGEICGHIQHQIELLTYRSK